MLHHIQKSILNTLSTTQSARYSDIKPKDMDGNIFSYHLKLLVADGYVTKNDNGLYSLRQKGKDYIVHRYEDSLLQAHSVFLLAIRHGDKWLMRERLVQPLIGMTGFVHGEPVASESVLVTASRRLAQKTGLEVPLRLHSSGLIRIAQNGVTESFSHALLLTGESTQSAITPHDDTGRNLWLHSPALTQPDILPSCLYLIEQITTNNTAPFDLTFNIK